MCLCPPAVSVFSEVLQHFGPYQTFQESQTTNSGKQTGARCRSGFPQPRKTDVSISISSALLPDGTAAMQELTDSTCLVKIYISSSISSIYIYIFYFTILILHPILVFTHKLLDSAHLSSFKQDDF